MIFKAELLSAYELREAFVYLRKKAEKALSLYSQRSSIVPSDVFLEYFTVGAFTIDLHYTNGGRVGGSVALPLDCVLETRDLILYLKANGIWVEDA